MRPQQSAFRHWMRTGFAPDAEHKFNPWHDPDDGRFTFANQGNYFGGGAAAQRRPRINPLPKLSPSSRPQPKRIDPARQEVVPSRPLGNLSQRFESSAKEDPGIVSSGKGDPGGVAYGPWQMATKRGTPAAFLASREGQIWAKSFGSTKPGTPEFTKVWKALSAKHREKFLESQRTFMGKCVGSAVAQGRAWEIGHRLSLQLFHRWSCCVRAHAGDGAKRRRNCFRQVSIATEFRSRRVP